jgi:hypothetical protein
MWCELLVGAETVTLTAGPDASADEAEKHSAAIATTSAMSSERLSFMGRFLCRRA